MRKQKIIKIDKVGRDIGKTFAIEEMSAFDFEDWVFRVFQGMAQAGADVPDEIAGAGAAGLMEWGIKGVVGMSWGQLKPLKDEMVDRCVQFVPDAEQPDIRVSIHQFPDTIEELSTLLTLRREVIDLHTGFFSGLDKASSPKEV